MQGDIFETLPRLSPDIVTANLFLHHLEDASVGAASGVGGGASRRLCHLRTAPFCLCRCWARGWSLSLGANDVTRHDALASVRAGFAGQELSSLWPKSAGWQIEERGVFPFTHLFVAERAMLHDAVVIGAGPAGSAAARLLAEAGWHVALVEKAAIPPPQGVRRIHLRHLRAGAEGLRRRRRALSPRRGRR